MHVITMYYYAVLSRVAEVVTMTTHALIFFFFLLLFFSYSLSLGGLEMLGTVYSCGGEELFLTSLPLHCSYCRLLLNLSVMRATWRSCSYFIYFFSPYVFPNTLIDSVKTLGLLGVFLTKKASGVALLGRSTTGLCVCS